MKNDNILMAIRNQLGRVYQVLSRDQGKTWTNVDSTDIQTPDSPITTKRIPQTGDLLTIWNDSAETRRPLTSAISKDEGETWMSLKDLETAEDQIHSHACVAFIYNDALLVYYVFDEKNRWVSLKLKKLPIKWFYT